MPDQPTASLNVNSLKFTGARVMNTWHAADDGHLYAAVQFDGLLHTWITYDDPALARAVAAAHIAAAEALEADQAMRCGECKALLPGHGLHCSQHEAPGYTHDVAPAATS